MPDNKELFEKYDLLLPSKYDGGYLIIAIDEKIRTGDLDGSFTTKEIDDILAETSAHFQLDSVPQWSRIKDNLLHYFIRNDAEEPGKYYLTDYAKGVLDMMRNKLNNPYKNHPLKKSFESSFYLRSNEIKDVEDLERKFGRLFISGPKKVITDHLEGLEDELRDAYKTLNELLENDTHEAVSLVKAFALTFRKFGERAEDITNAMRSKDKFLRDLQMVVDKFYAEIDLVRFSDNESEKIKVVSDWQRARDIYDDIIIFFNDTDRKIKAARRQIFNASEKLSELQEYFSTRANYRLQIQKLFGYVLQTAGYREDGTIFKNGFPLKSLVYEQEKMLYLKHYEFAHKKLNAVIQIPPDKEYEKEERTKIEKEINRQKIINHWVNNAKDHLNKHGQFLLDEMMNTILAEGEDLFVAYGVASEMISLVSEIPDLKIDITRELTILNQNNLALWKTKIRI
ncbi:hypothetical protein [Flavihumibacter sp. CACIAM 22H1]|uniref:hypothetical protein n=1 Tax=Flavihumibacter sp. CACIAM 22H1 TaxID=1812911 RepID=UPI0007A807AC|nr:hypothetical protein [Flavihumibacter sp. CACIAM 22H1]KYP15933.1 MAG: hypothetical protein A1D16_06305 [Flavihumibacter sp. CACIAM 22H1]